ncbi:sigma 54-interacting transcriptional regulator [Clostridiaceae bacterium M8S5]|nr:sigma 54-interacting transcriptional regulator [Clostridiaceae bacterium M8S5]
MGKTVAIVSHNTKAIEVFSEQIESLYADSLSIVKYYIDKNGLSSKVTDDIVLITSYEELEEVKDYIDSNSQIIFANRTISRRGMYKLNEISKGSNVLLLDESMDMAKGMIRVLYQIGITHLNIIPVTKDNYNKCVGDFIIIMGQSSQLEIPIEIVNIGNCILDISTIMDIAIKLKLEEVLTRQNIKKSYKEIITSAFGLSGILGKMNKFESQLEIILQVIDEGVLAINNNGLIFSYNDNAKRILGVKKNLININGIESYPQIPFKEILNNKFALKDKLIKIDDNDVIVSVDPITHSGKLYGAVAVIRNFSESERKQHKLRAKVMSKGHKAKYTFDDIIGESNAIKRCKEIAKRMSKSISSILITGESGTGKELFAQAIHNNSSRREYQFVAVNCGALPENLLESELFGYEEGAFTGAKKGGKPGLFELAHRGTLFLDEVGEMPMKLQMRLLRVLQEREVMRLGGDRLININLRLIAATNRNLKVMVNEGKFRQDLYYRLNVLPLKTPPLRTRVSDIIPLMVQIKRSFNSDFTLTKRAEKVLLEHSWKGNVRELSNYVEYFVNLGLSIIDIGDLPMDLREQANEKLLDKEEVDLVDRFIEIVGKHYDKYIFILEELELGFRNNKRMGRRSLYQRARESGLYISEQEIRKILLNLEKHLLVEIYKGRSGTVITEYGNRVIQYLGKG